MLLALRAVCWNHLDAEEKLKSPAAGVTFLIALMAILNALPDAPDEAWSDPDDASLQVPLVCSTVIGNDG